MAFFVGQRVQHFKSKRAGTVLEIPNAAPGLENQTHMLIKFEIDWPPEWRRMTAFEAVLDQGVAPHYNGCAALQRVRRITATVIA